MVTHESLFIVLGVASIVLFLGSVVMIPLIISYLPSDYFVRRPKPFFSLSLLRMTTRLLKNLFGLLFLFSGFILLFIPGQGVLTILIGISMLDFPGKQKLQLRMPKIREFIQWCRRKTNREPLLIPDN